MPRQPKEQKPETAKRRPGQPKKEIDLKQLETLCQMQCTTAEIAAFFDCSPKTIERHKADNPEVAAAMDNGKLKGLVSLRRAMFQNAITNQNTTMQIFLSKNLLGMKNDPEPLDVDTQKGKVVIGLPDGQEAELKPLNADALIAAGKGVQLQ